MNEDIEYKNGQIIHDKNNVVDTNDKTEILNYIDNIQNNLNNKLSDLDNNLLAEINDISRELYNYKELVNRIVIRIISDIGILIIGILIGKYII